MKIVVLSKGYEVSLGIGRSLKESGFDDVDLVFIGYFSFIVRESNAFNKRYFIPERNDKEIIEKLIEWYSDYGKTEKIILFSSDDYTTSLIDRYRKKLESIFLMTYVDGNDAGAVTKLMDKEYQAKKASDFGLKTAKSWTAVYDGAKFNIPDGITYPCFVKPLVSANGKLAKANMAKCSDKKELLAHLNHLSNTEQTDPLLIQEFLSIEDEYDIHGICDGKQIFIPVIHKKLVTSKSLKGVTVLGEIMNPSILGDPLSNLKDMLASFGFHGLFDIEMFTANGQLYLNEINVRIAGTCYGPTLAGVNLPELWIRCLNGESYNNLPQNNVKFNMIFINDKTAYEDFIHGVVSKKEFNSWNEGEVFHLIKSEDDPEPWTAFLKDMKRRSFDLKMMKIKRPIKKALKMFLKK